MQGNGFLAVNDGKEWSEMDLRDLRAAIENGATFEDAALFLCRASTVDDVAQKARELGLQENPPGCCRIQVAVKIVLIRAERKDDVLAVK